MKHILTSVLICMVTLVTRADIILNEGQSYVFSFDSSDFEYQYHRISRATVLKAGFQLAGPTTSTTTYIFNMYQNSLDEDPFSSSTQTLKPSSFGLTYSNTAIWDPDTNETITYWDDDQGILELIITQGSATVTQITAGKVVDGGVYYARAIPEPQSVALIIIGSGILYIRRKTIPNKRGEHTRYNA